MKELTPYLIETITYGSESREIEFKPPFGWDSSHKPLQIEVVRAALAFSNSPRGGHVIIGISQEQDRSDGIKFTRKGLAVAAYAFYSATFISVWCFFSAIVSLEVYLYFVYPPSSLLKPISSS